MQYGVFAYHTISKFTNRLTGFGKGPAENPDPIATDERLLN